jgi:hypothetical protein
MEEKSYNWLLLEFHKHKVPLRILETGICRGSKLLDWFITEASGVVTRKTVKENTRTKTLLNYFLNQRVPILEEYNPEKIICYLYHRKGVKIVTAKESIELAENQLHGLQVRSIHMALPSCSNPQKVYRVTAWKEDSELQTQLTYGRIVKETNEEVKDPVVYEKAMSLTVNISDFIYKNYQKYIKSIKIDLILDSLGQLYVIKIKELILTSEFVKSQNIYRGNHRHNSLKILEFSSEDISLLDNTEDYNPIKILQEKKKEINFKIQLRKPTAQNSSEFLKMMAKTFDRQRKTQETLKILENKRIILEKNQNDNKRISLQSLNMLSYTLHKKNSITNINDLLSYVENTRPRIWVKDKGEDEACLEIPLLTDRNPKKKYTKSFSTINQTNIPKVSYSSSAFSFKNERLNKIINFLSEEEKRLKDKMSSGSFKYPVTSTNFDSKSTSKSRLMTARPQVNILKNKKFINSYIFYFPYFI